MGQCVIIEMRNVIKSYKTLDGAQVILDGVNFTALRGEFISVLGPSGSGKTTMMNILGCLDTPTSGSYILRGRDTSGLSESSLASVRSREIGFVFQSFNLLPRLTALQNVELPLVYAGVPPARRKELAGDILARVGLGDKLKYYPNQLSGGQQQRVAAARALVSGPAVLLADEPTGALDRQSGGQVMELLHGLHDEGHTIIMITHDAEIAAHAARTVRLLDGKLFVS